jgi:hypothetical protein
LNNNILLLEEAGENEAINENRKAFHDVREEILKVICFALKLITMEIKSRYFC